MQLVISSDGVCGLCYEHSAAEGLAVIQLMEKMLKEAASPAPAVANAEAPRSPPAAVANAPPRLLGWNVDSVTRGHLDAAAKAVDR